MKKLVGLLVGAFMLFGVVGGASALQYIDLDDTSVTFKESDGITAYTWSFDLANDTLAVGDIGSNDIINTAYLGFSVRDDSGDLGSWFTEYIDITVNGTKYVDDWEMDNGNWMLNVNLVGSGSIFDFSVDFDDYDGWNRFTDTTVFDVQIYGDYDPVPEPATMLLFGLGLLGLAGVSRKKR